MSPKAKKEEIVQEGVAEETPQKTADKPSPRDPKWQEYVLSLLSEDELSNGNPTTDGLRRVASIALDKTVIGTAKIVQGPTKDNGMVAAVEYTVKTIGRGSLHQIGTMTPYWSQPSTDESFTDCADASPSNCNPPFSLHPTAMACTRAEGRALRKLLKLRKVATAEELDTPRDVKDEEGNPTYINFSQFSALNTLFKKNNLNGAKYISKYTEKYHSAKYEITRVPYPVAVELIKHVQKWSHGKNPDDLPVPPEDVQGYDENFMTEWKN